MGLRTELQKESTKMRNQQEEVSGVFLTNEHNSQVFTTCCNVAICEDQQRCPKCRRLVVGWDATSYHKRDMIRWKYAYRKKRV